METPAPFSIVLRPIQALDDPVMAQVIREVMTEFGVNREGFAFVDAEVESMSAAYQPPRAAYYVLDQQGHIVGGAGFAPLEGGDGETAELRKMYIYSEVRGQGYGRALMNRIVHEARQAGFRRLYLETTDDMHAAMRLYERSGFQRLLAPLGATGHFGCQVWYARNLLEPTD
jgi:putative acetyltransferase